MTDCKCQEKQRDDSLNGKCGWASKLKKGKNKKKWSANWSKLQK